MLTDLKAADLKRKLDAQKHALCAELYVIGQKQEELAQQKAGAESKLAANSGAREVVELALADAEASDGEATAD